MGKAARTRVRLQVSVLVSVFWLVLGMFIMVAFQGATYCCSIFATNTLLYTLSLRLLLDADWLACGAVLFWLRLLGCDPNRMDLY